MRQAITGIAIGLLLAAVAFFALDWFNKPEPAVQAQPAPELKGEATTKLACKPVVIYRDKVAKDLGVPAEQGRHVVAATKVPGDDHPRTITATWNESDGRVTQFVRRDPLPLFATINQLDVGLGYGVKLNEGTVYRLDAQWDLIQIKALKTGLYGQADSDGTGMVGVRAHIRF